MPLWIESADYDMPDNGEELEGYSAPKRLLELFSGTGSVRKAVGNRFEEVISIDILQKFNPTECCDILTWDYTKFPPGYFDCIWASPPCTEYSTVKRNGKMNQDLDFADSIVQRTLAILAYFNPTKWFIENPQTGMLKDRDFMLGIPFYDVDYCRFSDWGYKKRTRIWTNVSYEDKLCLGAGECQNMEGKYHRVSLGGQGRKKPHVYKKVSAEDVVYRIPERLIKELFDAPL